MGRLIYAMMVSLDGFVATPDGGLDWVRIDEELHAIANEDARRTALELYGRGMYETMTAFWPYAEDDPGQPEVIHEYARIWKRTPRVVFSRTLTEVGHNSRLATAEVATEVARLKATTDGDLSVSGAALAAECIRLGLVDEFRPYVQPVILGAGKPFLPPLERRIDLRLVSEQRLASGVEALRYEVAPAS
jgi:dihydrofolate reductase